MKKFIYLLLVAAALLVSCSSSDDETGSNEYTETFVLTKDSQPLANATVRLTEDVMTNAEYIGDGKIKDKTTGEIRNISICHNLHGKTNNKGEISVVIHCTQTHHEYKYNEGGYGSYHGNHHHYSHQNCFKGYNYHLAIDHNGFCTIVPVTLGSDRYHIKF